MSLVNQQLGSYRLARKLCVNRDYKVYQAVHIRSHEERIIQLAKLEGKLNKKESRARLKQKVESLRAMHSPYIIPIQKCDFAEIKGENYLYVRTSSFKSISLEEWLQLREKTNPLSQQDVASIMRQAREAVDAFHSLGIAPLNIRLSSFVVETTENPNRPRVFLKDILPAVLHLESIRKASVKRKQAITGDLNALQEMEGLLNRHVEETVTKPVACLESPLQNLERRLLLAEAEKEQLQRQLHELEEEKERILSELQQQREAESRRLLLAKAEKERVYQDLQQQKERNSKLLSGAILASTATRAANTPPIASSSGGTSRRSMRWFWVPGGLLLMAVIFAGTTFLFAGLFFFEKPARAYFGSSSAKVTITQAAYGLTDNYIFTGVTHSTSEEKTQSITVPATNLVVIPGRSSTGTLTFHNTQNPCNVAVVIPAGTIFTDARGITMATDKATILGASCNAASPAHALKIGSAGNIGAHAMKQTYRTTIMIDNPVAFVGGQFDQSYTTVQQSDIDHATSSLAGPLKQETLAALHMQLLTNQQFVSSPICNAKRTSDHQANDVATQVTVTATVTCKAEFYSPQEIISRSEHMLNNRAQALFGPNYTRTGNIQAEITHIATDVKHSTLITVIASGLWKYQFSSVRANQLARQVSGMNKQDAQSMLSNQQGVQSASINISDAGTTMPYDATSIHIAYVTTLVPIQEGAVSY